MKLLAVSVGQPRAVDFKDKQVMTSIFKAPVQGPVEVHSENIVGDRQSDLRVHGGIDKAVYGYSYDTYPWWQKTLGIDPLPFGAMGENLTFESLDEKNIFVGDVFQLGSCHLEAVQPRFPCFKLGILYNDQSIIQTFNDYRRPGVYFRVKKEGIIQAGDALKLIHSESIKASIDELFAFTMIKGSMSKSRAAEIAQVPSMNESFRKKLLQ